MSHLHNVSYNFQWEDAKETCEYDGRQLASVLNARESKKSKEECTWLGGNYLDNEKEWDWIDGMALHKLGLESKCRCECGDGKFKSNT